MPGMTRCRQPVLIASADAPRSVDVRVPISMLSVYPSRAINRVACLIGAALAQGVALVALFGHATTIPLPVEAATIAWITPPPVAVAEPVPEPVTAPPALSEAATSEVVEADPSATDQMVVAEVKPAETEVVTQPPADPAPVVTPPDEQSREVAAASLPAAVDPPKPSHDRPRMARPAPPPSRHVDAPISQPTHASISATVSMTVSPLAVPLRGAPDPGAEMILRAAIREAVQAAVRCPAGARMMKLSGKAGVAFDYRDGTVIGDARLTRSAGVPMLDVAALEAVRHAHYPPPPAEAINHLLRLLVWVDEACAS
jgi:periplasmic protein TonB